MKTSNAIALTYNDITIHFTGDAWFNATEAADKYGKRPIDWLKQKDSIAYQFALAKALGISDSQSLIYSRRNVGTWLHPKLGVAFARWLDPDFAVWCDMQIDALIRGNHDFSNPPREKYIHAKRDEHGPMTDMLKFTRELMEKATVKHHYENENLFCNRALTGKWEPLDESTLDNYDITLLAAIRRRNTMLIAHFLKQADRKGLMDDFVTDYRLKHPRLTLATLDGKLLEDK